MTVFSDNLSPAVRKLKEEFITEAEFAALLGVNVRRLQDMRCRDRFINFYKPAKNCILYHVDDVRAYITAAFVDAEHRRKQKTLYAIEAESIRAIEDAVINSQNKEAASIKTGTEQVKINRAKLTEEAEDKTK